MYVYICRWNGKLTVHDRNFSKVTVSELEELNSLYFNFLSIVAQYCPGNDWMKWTMKSTLMKKFDSIDSRVAKARLYASFNRFARFSRPSQFSYWFRVLFSPIAFRYRPPTDSEETGWQAIRWAVIRYRFPLENALSLDENFTRSIVCVIPPHLRFFNIMLHLWLARSLVAVRARYLNATTERSRCRHIHGSRRDSFSRFRHDQPSERCEKYARTVYLPNVLNKLPTFRKINYI